jgi:hypothetical protein
MKLRLTSGQLIAGEWREPGHEFEAPAPLAEHFLRAGAAVPADSPPPPAPPAPPAPSKAADPGREKHERATDPRRK